MINGLSLFFTTSKNASPLSFTSRSFTLKFSLYSILLSAFNHTCVPSGNCIFDLEPAFVLTVFSANLAVLFVLLVEKKVVAKNIIAAAIQAAIQYHLRLEGTNGTTLPSVSCSST